MALKPPSTDDIEGEHHLVHLVLQHVPGEHVPERLAGSDSRARWKVESNQQPDDLRRKRLNRVLQPESFMVRGRHGWTGQRQRPVRGDVFDRLKRLAIEDLERRQMQVNGM